VRPRIVTATGIIVILIGLASAWCFSRRSQITEATLAEAHRDRSQLEQRVARLKTAVRAAPTPQPSTKRVVSQKSTETEASRQKQMDTEAQKNADERNVALLASADLQLLFEDSRRAMYRAEFAALFRRLHISPEQQKAFVNALVAWDMKMKDLDAVVKQQGLSKNDPAIKAQRAEANATVERVARDVLGPQGTKVTQEYSRLDSARNYVAAYGGLLSRIGEPLTFDQFERLTNAFDGISDPKQPTLAELNTAQWDRAQPRIQAILTPAQWEVFQSATPPGQYASRWESAFNEAFANASAGKTKE
jgi:hypothetical protein